MAPFAIDFVARFCERNRGQGTHGMSNLLSGEESINARLAVKAMQTGEDPSFYLEEAGLCRATKYEFKATGDILRDLNAERLVELRRRTGRSDT